MMIKLVVSIWVSFDRSTIAWNNERSVVAAIFDKFLWIGCAVGDRSIIDTNMERANEFDFDFSFTQMVKKDLNVF